MHSPVSENNFARCFLLEILERGFPLQMNMFENTQYLTTTQLLLFKG